MGKRLANQSILPDKQMKIIKSQEINVNKEPTEFSIAEFSCPFCKEEGFDLIGLKSHLVHGDCEKYNEIDIVSRRFGFN